MKVYPWKYAKIFGQRFMQDFKDRSFITLRLWTDHCEYIVAQRIRRGQQIITFYDRIWGEKAFRDLLKGLRRQVQRHIKGIMLSSVSIYAFDWNTNRIQNDVLKLHENEIDLIHKLRKETLYCSICNKRKLISEKIDGIDYCKCPKNLCTTHQLNNKSNNNLSYKYHKDNSDINIYGWEPYLEKKGMIIWRKEDKPSLYAYKVYVKYLDITAEDFLQVQTDIEYRKKWDDTALALEIVDTDPDDIDKSQVIYWEMRWPKLFANRDYVFVHRHFTDKKRNIIVICNKSTEHPKCPINSNKQRVNDYWSNMVIKPFESFDQPGLEFVLTYFDDPGLAIPSTITSWVAQKQMPEFLFKLYYATKDYAQHKRNENSKKSISTWKKNYKINNKKETELNEKINFKTKENESNEKTDEIIRIQHQQKQQQEQHNQDNYDNNSNNNTTVDNDDAVVNDCSQQENKSWWMYLRPHYYFA